MFIKTQISILGVYEWSSDAENSALHHNNSFNFIEFKDKKKAEAAWAEETSQKHIEQ